MTRFLVLALCLLFAAGARADDLTLSEIRIAQQGDASRVTLEFNGTGKPKGRVAITDNKVVVEVTNARSGKNVKIAASKTELIVAHQLREGEGGIPALTLATSAPTKLSGPPNILPADKKVGPRLYFEVKRDPAATGEAKAAPQAPAPQAAVPAPSPAQLAELEAAAKAGDVQAQVALAGLLARQAKPDFAGALKWYTAAAEQGSAPAAFNVAQYTRLGMGVAANPQAAFQWYERSAAVGFPPAQVALAILLLKGDGMDQDPERARFLLQQAAAAGEPQAKAILETLGGQ